MKIRIDMATIEERAKVVFPNSTYLSSKQRNAYAIGAIEQKAIDIEQACEWLKEVFEGGGYVQDWQIDEFLTFMEESHK